MSLRRLALRLAIRTHRENRDVCATRAFSKKWENLKAAYALWFAWYNFCRVHSTLRVTPALEAGITDHIWTIGALLGTVSA